MERVNQTLWNKIKKLCSFGETSWEKVVDKATRAVNICYNRSIGTSPYILLHGQLPTLPVDNLFGLRNTHVDQEEVNRNLDKLREKYDKEIIQGKKSIPYNLNSGDAVLIYRDVGKGKLAANWVQGFKIKKKIEPDAYVVTDGNKEYRVNKNRVKRDF